MILFFILYFFLLNIKIEWAYATTTVHNTDRPIITITELFILKKRLMIAHFFTRNKWFWPSLSLDKNFFKKNIKHILFLAFFLCTFSLLFIIAIEPYLNSLDSVGSAAALNDGWFDWLFGSENSAKDTPPDVPKIEPNQTKTNSPVDTAETPPKVEAVEEEEYEEYDTFLAIWGPELTWWEWIKESIYTFLFGPPVDPFVPFEEWAEAYFDRHKVPKEDREAYLNAACPPEPPPPTEDPSAPQVIVIDPIAIWWDTCDFFWELFKKLLLDAWNVFNFSIYYTDQVLRYFLGLIPISVTTWQYLILLAFSVVSLGYMYALMFHEETLYTRVIYHDLRHIPIREIYFFHEYFLGWSIIIACLLMSTTIK